MLLVGDTRAFRVRPCPRQVWEVVRVDPTVGGTVIMKGGVNNLTPEERAEPWSQFGLSLQGDATLM